MQGTLTADEVHMASCHGIYRRIQKLSGLRQDREQRGRSTWDNEIEGACAELAFCKLMGMYWSGVSSIRSRDGHRMEVRWTHYEKNGGLIVYPGDHTDDIFVLVTGLAPTYTLAGWAVGGEAKDPSFKDDLGGYYLLPRDRLRPISTL